MTTTSDGNPENRKIPALHTDNRRIPVLTLLMPDKNLNAKYSHEIRTISRFFRKIADILNFMKVIRVLRSLFRILEGNP